MVAELVQLQHILWKCALSEELSLAASWMGLDDGIASGLSRFLLWPTGTWLLGGSDGWAEGGIV